MIRFGMALMEMIEQLTKGFIKVTGRQPDNLEKLKIQQEAVQRFKDMNKVVDMEGNVIDTSKGIMGGKQADKFISKNKIKKRPANEDRALEDFVDDAGGVNPDDPRGIDDFIPDPEDMAQGGRAGFSKGKIVKEGLEGLAQLLKKEKARTQRISGNLRLENMQRTEIGKPKKGVDYDYYRELLDDDENFIVMGDETEELLEAMVKEQEAEMAYMKRLYDKGALNPTAGETTMGRLKMLEDKAQKGEALSVDEIAEIKRLSEIFNKADGGRIGLKDGMSRRKFMQIMGGIAALPIIGKFFKAGKVAAPAVEAAKETVTQVPSYFFDLANKIKIFGKEGVPTGPRKTTTNYKNYELDEDLTTGEMRITKTNEGGISTDDGMIDGISSQEVMEYIPGERILTKEGKSIKTPDMYEEATIRPDMDGKMKDIDDGLDDVQSIIEDAKSEAPSIKKAGGGIARMLGE